MPKNPVIFLPNYSGIMNEFLVTEKYSCNYFQVFDVSVKGKSRQISNACDALLYIPFIKKGRRMKKRNQFYNNLWFRYFDLKADNFICTKFKYKDLKQFDVNG